LTISSGICSKCVFGFFVFGIALPLPSHVKPSRPPSIRVNSFGNLFLSLRVAYPLN
jgi:hypothetical protein